ncbi:MAG TPA: tRNA (adenosine(37)-N6)-threonylcarbamoyltransferase complex dimerization subunit type 1 TsaB [Caulobacteraceae bacterium]|jgi:tRNA threonylcarbamoyladenosine biosynthesis protein TsaB|nr:tRNA (adenosine(37)-N6)-threonylcarbamoyltransferase complex dimerization subunit type 1 TsaB [Caulobacteraceae bacterium]
MLILVVDTCLAMCQAALVRGGVALASSREPMVRGHQERLAPMVSEVMAAAGVRLAEVERIAVTAGPGSFTGLRVGLAFAKGLALALERPCLGVGTLAALAASEAGDGFRTAAIDAGRGAVYLQCFAGEDELSAPDRLPLETAAARIIQIGRDQMLIGPQASALALVLPGSTPVDLAAPSPLAIAGLAAKSPVVPPRPLYLRAPDAKIAAARTPR